MAATLHPRTKPGLVGDASWVRLSRWGMAWRATVACSLLGLTGVLALTLDALTKRERVSLIEVPLGVIFAIIMPALLGLLALGLSAWLRRFSPFTQALLFGGISGGLAFLLWTGTGSLAGAPDYGLIVFAAFFGLPISLMGCVGYLLAIWFSTRTGARIIWPIFGVLLAVFVTLSALAWAGIFTTMPVGNEESENGIPECGRFTATGELVEMPCDAFNPPPIRP